MRESICEGTLPSNECISATFRHALIVSTIWTPEKCLVFDMQRRNAENSIKWCAAHGNQPNVYTTIFSCVADPVYKKAPASKYLPWYISSLRWWCESACHPVWRWVLHLQEQTPPQDVHHLSRLHMRQLMHVQFRDTSVHVPRSHMRTGFPSLFLGMGDAPLPQRRVWMPVHMCNLCIYMLASPVSSKGQVTHPSPRGVLGSGARCAALAGVDMLRLGCIKQRVTPVRHIIQCRLHQSHHPSDTSEFLFIPLKIFDVVL